MSRKQLATSALAFVIAAAAVSGCGQTSATAPVGSNVSPADLAFITNAYNVTEFDRTIAAEAQTRASDPRVRALAAELLLEANQFRDKVNPVAEQLGIQPPAVVSFGQRADLQERVANLIRTGGHDYDREFLDDEIATHEEALSRQQRMAADSGGNPQLRALSAEGTGLLRTNLAKLQALRSQLPG